MTAQSPWWFGLKADHLYENCPGRQQGLPELRRYGQDRQGNGVVDPYGTDICGWCSRVWIARNGSAESNLSEHRTTVAPFDPAGRQLLHHWICTCGRKSKTTFTGAAQAGWAAARHVSHARKTAPGAAWTWGTLKERFAAKVAVNAQTGCWEWTGALSPKGYGVIADNGRHLRAHRVAYELYVGEIPAGMTIDHLCRVRHCVNSAHLEAVTSRENTLRGIGLPAVNAAKTHCKHGHRFTPENTYVSPNGWRNCRTCSRNRSPAAARARQAGAVSQP